MNATDWQGRNEDAPKKFGRKAQAWFLRRLRRQLFKPVGPDDPDGFAPRWERLETEPDETWAPSSVEYLLAWFAEHAEEFVQWVDSDTYHGGGFSNGGWSIDMDVVKAAIPRAIDAADFAADMDGCDTLDDWLRLDLSDELLYRGDKGGFAIMPEEMRQELAHRNDLRLTTLRCSGCKKPFVRDRKRAKKCAACREQTRVAAEARKQARKEAWRQVMQQVK